MDTVCVRCAARTLSNRNLAAVGAKLGSRSFSISRTLMNDKSDDSGVARAGSTLESAIGQNKTPSGQSRNPTITRRPTSAGPVIRRTSGAISVNLQRGTVAAGNQQEGTQSRGVLVRRSSPQPGQLLRRVAPTGSTPNTTRATGPASAERRPGGTLLRRQGPGRGVGQGQNRGRDPRQQTANQRGKGRPDKRLRKSAEQAEEIDEEAFEREFQEYVEKYVDRPANPTEALPYNPTRLTLDDLKSDWPNTLLSTSGMTESVVQKVQWLARRLPHGYQSPEQIAEHYLKGNLTRFESEEERKTVLQLAAELSAKTKTEKEDGTLHKHETPRFAIVEDPAFTSIASKKSDKDHIMTSSIRGDYDRPQQQKYAFMQTASKILNNNETYGPVQSQKLLTRVQALIPQARAGGAQQTKKA